MKTTNIVVPKGLNELAHAIYRLNIDKGYYDSEKNIGEMLCLIHSEVSEAMEADRKGRYADCNMDVVNGWVSDEDFVKDYKKKVKGTADEEMADVFIRNMDFCGFKNIDVEAHVKAKMRYNAIVERDPSKRY